MGYGPWTQPGNPCGLALRCPVANQTINPLVNRRDNYYFQRRSNINSQPPRQRDLNHPYPQSSPPRCPTRNSPQPQPRILQEITAVSRRIEEMDASISSLTLETKSMRSDIAGFQSRVTGLEHHMGTLEMQVATYRDRDQDLLYLRSKKTDMVDRSQRDNICLLGIPENEEGTDIQAFLGSTLPKLNFDSPLEFQRAHRVGPKRPDRTSRPQPIIACLLRHNQTRQILQAA
ncbi:hypothetical protein NDU88_006675 [Pleurodeles waltl]|uniref:Uncharacterized protein n=1 Tax=Pleurodeles waltl TaxID=8319 RepID=A0AAV7VMK3_PLEWA|nr:hypothetical protein NDU88_006675 [Pleurodeles waltl]